MKKYILFIGLSLCLQTTKIKAQNITFSFANAVTTATGANGFFEADVMIEASVDFKMGSGQLYFNYNTTAFGSNVFASNNVVFSAPDNSYILGEKAFGVLNIYTSFITNDNTTSRVSFSWQQDFGDICIANSNVSATATKLFHIRFDFIASGVSETPGICFESNAPFDNQTFTSCELTGGTCGTCNSGSDPGTQLMTDIFDCSALVLPLELIDFQATAKPKLIQLDWTSEGEYDFDNYELERSINGKDFQFISQMEGIGGDFVQDYFFEDEAIQKGQLYYYRLKMNDQDGSFSYSLIKTAQLDKPLTIKIFPNPTVDILNVNLMDFESTEIRIHNMSGREMNRILNPDFSNKINVSDLPEGCYLLSIIGDNGVIFNDQFVKVSNGG